MDATSGEHVPISSAKMDAVTLAFGPRLHFEMSEHARIHPGLSIMSGFDARGFDAPMITAETTAVQVESG